MSVNLENTERESDKIQSEATLKRCTQYIWRKAKNLNVKILYVGFRHQSVTNASANQKCAAARSANNPRNLENSLVHKRQSR
jgi:hypothetical protein